MGVSLLVIFRQQPHCFQLRIPDDIRVGFHFQVRSVDFRIAEFSLNPTSCWSILTARSCQMLFIVCVLLALLALFREVALGFLRILNILEACAG